jgi:hypothetical protein
MTRLLNDHHGNDDIENEKIKIYHFSSTFVCVILVEAIFFPLQEQQEKISIYLLKRAKERRKHLFHSLIHDL